jgi:hypothetical protein
MSSNKKPGYEGRHSLPAHGEVRDLNGNIWRSKAGGTHWHTNEPNTVALSTNDLAALHGPLIVLNRG